MQASRVFVIAEAGVNHNGSLETALELCSAAKEAKADAVKFQLFNSERLNKPELKPLEMSPSRLRDIKAYCKAIDIEFLCTPFDVDSLDCLLKMGVQRLKISSGCLTDNDLLYAAYRSGLPVILSTGMSTILEIHRALDMLHDYVTLLHCTSAYPCPIHAVNLKAMDDLAKTFRRPVGYSDHTQGITIAVAAAARGATVIEKHLTLSRNQEGPDHKASIEPGEFSTMVSAVRTVEESLGDGVKRVQDCELELRKAWR